MRPWSWLQVFLSLQLTELMAAFPISSHLLRGSAVGILILVASNLASASSSASNAIAELEAIASTSSSNSEKSASINRVLDSSVWPRVVSLNRQPDDSVHEVFRSMEIAYFYARMGDYPKRDSYRTGMRDALVEMKARGIQEKEEVESYYDSLMMARDFSSLEALKVEYPGFSFRDYGRFSSDPGRDDRGLYVYKAVDGGHLKRSRIDLPVDGNYAVVVVGCHFATDAARALVKNEMLSRAMSDERVIWMFSDMTLDQHDLNRWNKEFPLFQAMIAFDNAAWDGVDFSATPSFYFFKAGRLAGTHEGWGDRASESRVLELAKGIGLAADPRE